MKNLNIVISKQGYILAVTSSNIYPLALVVNCTQLLHTLSTKLSTNKCGKAHLFTK